MWSRLSAIVLCALVASAGLARTVSAQKGNPKAAQIKNPVAANSESITAGEPLYRRRCAGCHAVDATGGPPKDAGDPAAANLVDDTWDYGGTDGEIFTVIRDGIGPDYRMEGFGDRLNDNEIWHIVNYVRSLKKK